MISRVTTLPTNRLTHESLTDLFCRDSKDSKNLHHYLYNQVLHCFTQLHLNVGLETFEIVFDSIEHINKRVLACANIFSSLQTLWSDWSAPINEIAYHEEDPDPGKDHFCRREHLRSGC
jgi:hypothetical protein